MRKGAGPCLWKDRSCHRGKQQPEGTVGRVSLWPAVFRPPLSCLRTASLQREKGPTPPALGLPLWVGLAFPASGTMSVLLSNSMCVTWHPASPTIVAVLPSTVAQRSARGPTALHQPLGETCQPGGTHTHYWKLILSCLFSVSVKLCSNRYLTASCSSWRLWHQDAVGRSV